MKALVMGDIQFGNSIDLHSLYQTAKIIADKEIAMVIDVGDIIDYFRIYDWQKTHVYASQAKIAAVWLRWIAQQVDRVIYVAGNHDKRPFGDGLWPIIKQLLPPKVEFYPNKEAIVSFGGREILVVHGDFMEGSATLRGPSPSFLLSLLLYTINKWKQGYKHINTVVAGHIHSPIGFRRYGERGFGHIEPEKMLDVIVIPSYQKPRTIKYSSRGIVLIEESMKFYPEIINFKPDLGEGIDEDIMIIFYAEMLKEYRKSEPDIMRVFDEVKKYAGW